MHTLQLLLREDPTIPGAQMQCRFLFVHVVVNPKAVVEILVEVGSPINLAQRK
jgi:hypothetical protein